MKISSRASFAVAAVLLASVASCAPQAMYMTVEMREASKSGLDLGGKTVAVVYLEGEVPGDGSFNSELADGFAQRLEQEYFGSSREVELFSLEKDPKGSYSSKDTLQQMIMATGKDVVFIFDTPLFGELAYAEPVRAQKYPAQSDSAWSCTVRIPFTTRVYAYDSMNKEDKVFAFNGANTLTPVAYGPDPQFRSTLSTKIWSSLGNTAVDAGYEAGNVFAPTWVSENCIIIYYDWDNDWTKAAQAAYKFRWQEAIDLWIGLLDTGNLEKRSCAEYDIALGCYMLGEFDLCLEWLDRSDKDCPVSLSKSLRTRALKRAGR